MITFYPTISRGELGKHANAKRMLLVASSFAASEVRKHGCIRKHLPIPRLPVGVIEKAADCGGFVATMKWKGYRYTPEQYHNWLSAWRPDWAAMMDFCCEPGIANSPEDIRERQDQTTDMARYFWATWQTTPWAWVPTIQGWEVPDYERHAAAMKPLIEEMQAYYRGINNPYFRVGIGTLCARASTEMIHQVVRAVSAVLPGVPFHLWGVKLGTFKAGIALPESVVSVDSAAWNGLRAHGRNEWKTSGMTQREWCFKVALPRYEQRVVTALSQPKQIPILWEVSHALA